MLQVAAESYPELNKLLHQQWDLMQGHVQHLHMKSSIMLKHNFNLLACRLLLESSPELNKLPQEWLNFMLAYVQRSGQSRDDIVRRSAGTPCAFVALFAAEPTGHPKTLLQIGKRYLKILS